ncbi:MAG: non-ribosomal peptide synthetase, partial [bacterium]|nr:non-ribosomal peptide synthetase [bacterium]
GKIASGEIKKQEEYWLERFKGEIPVLKLPLDFERPPQRNFAGRIERFSITGEEAARLKNLAKDEGATSFMLVLALFNTLLYKVCFQEDIVTGTVIAGRSHPDLDEIIGMFVNTLALRNYPMGEKTFVEFLREVKVSTLEAFDNQDYQFENLVEKLVLERAAGRNPLFDVLFSFTARNPQNPIAGSTPMAESGGDELKVRPYGEGDPVTKFDMIFSGIDTGEGFSFVLEYSTELFKEETIQRFTGYFREVVSAAAGNTGTRLKDIAISHQLLEAASSLYQDAESEFDL